MVYLKLLESFRQKQKVFCLLIDPAKYDNSADRLAFLMDEINKTKVDVLLVGGSLVTKPVDLIVNSLKQITDIPVVLFPGSLLQISAQADAILLLSLLSGRNAELLIGNHVVAAPFIKQFNLEVIPTGYLLVEGGTTTAVEYMSQTKPIPAGKPDIAAATALAGEMLGYKLIYLEAGSGAAHPVPVEMIGAVRQAVNIPLVVGGGLRTIESVRSACSAGADVVVIGNVLENDYALIQRFADAIHENR